MKELNEKVIKMLNTQMWYLCSNGTKPVSSIIPFKEINKYGKLVFPVFYNDKLISAIKNNNKIAVSVADERGMTGYQIKGTAQFIQTGETSDKWKNIIEKMFSTSASFKGIIEITPEKAIITTPGKNNNKEI